MDVIHIGQGSDKLTHLPKPPVFLDPGSKKFYKKIGELLIKTEVLREIHLTTLEMLATNYSQWAFAVREIARKNKEASGTGYIQTFTSQATNISTELVLKRDAEKAMRENLAAFGMDPQSEKKLKTAIDPAQGDLFDQFNKKHAL